MSDDVLRMLYEDRARLRQTETKEVPPLYLPWSQRALNPFPLASSGGVWGEMPLPWPVNVLAITASVDCITTNNGTNYWTLTFTSGPSATVLGTKKTDTTTVNVLTRLVVPITAQPPTTDAHIYLTLTATLSPGSIFVFPALALLRTGN